MTWVKLCGLRTAEDVAMAVALGADAIGLVTASRSVRAITPAHAALISDTARIARFLVTEDLEPDELLRQVEMAGVTGVQPHGRDAREAADAAAAAGLQVLLPVTVGEVVLVPTGMTPMIDGPRPGSGQPAEWSSLGGLGRRFVLAGGLDPANVAEAVRLTGAYGVDVSSGIESEPGVKDHELMRQFVAALA